MKEEIGNKKILDTARLASPVSLHLFAPADTTCPLLARGPPHCLLLLLLLLLLLSSRVVFWHGCCEQVPQALTEGGLVVGMPPWGTMYHYEIAQDPHLRLLFMHGTASERYTFHTGVEVWCRGLGGLE